MKKFKEFMTWLVGVAGDAALELGVIKALSIVLEKICTEEFMKKHPWLTSLMLALYFTLGLGTIVVVIFFRPIGSLVNKISSKIGKKETKEDDFE